MNSPLSTQMLRLLPVAAALLLCPLHLQASDSAASSPEQLVEFDSGKDQLTLRTHERELEEVLDEIASATDVEFIHSGLGDDLVTADLQHVPLIDALKELLSHRSFLFQLDPETKRPARVWVMGRKSQVDGATERQVSRIEPTAEEEDEILDATKVLERISKGEFTEEDTESIIQSVIDGDDDEAFLEQLVTGSRPDDGDE